MNRAAAYIADIVLPNRCPCCGRFIKWDKLLCGECIEALPVYDSGGEEPPEGCSAAVSAYIYDGAAKKGVLAIKEGHGRNMAVWAAEVLAGRLEGCGAELIASVPMLRKAKAERGCDHARVIAKALSARMGIPYDGTLLMRKGDDILQHELKAYQRRDNAEAIYFEGRHPNDIRGKHILLIDDIHTTGATLSACAKILKALGAAEVIAATICQSQRRRRNAADGKKA